MTPAGPDTIELSVCVCVGGNGMFNTISKACLLCLRLVRRGASLLQSGVSGAAADPCCLCASQTLLMLRGSAERMPVGWGVSVLLLSWRSWNTRCLCFCHDMWTCSACRRENREEMVVSTPVRTSSPHKMETEEYQNFTKYPSKAPHILLSQCDLVFHKWKCLYWIYASKRTIAPRRILSFRHFLSATPGYKKK